MSRCQRKIVAGVTISRNPAKRSAGSVPASAPARPVRPRQPRMSPRPLAQGHRELMAQHQDLGVLPPRLPPRQAQHRHGPGHDEEHQLQAHKPKIIARQPEPDLPARHRSRDRANGVPQSISPGGAGFRHRQAKAGPCKAGRRSTSWASPTFAGRRETGASRLRRITIKKRLRAKLKQVKAEPRRRRSLAHPRAGALAGERVEGTLQLLRRARQHRFDHSLPQPGPVAMDPDAPAPDQRHRMTWERYSRIEKKWLPPARIVHPYPSARFAARTQGRSPVR